LTYRRTGTPRYYRGADGCCLQLKTLCCHLATGGIYRSLDAGEREALNGQRIPPVDFKGVMKEQVLGAPLFVIAV